jgi:hypothetical protein
VLQKLSEKDGLKIEKYTDQMIEQGDTKALKARYDYASGKYLTIERWLD